MSSDAVPESNVLSYSGSTRIALAPAQVLEQLALLQSMEPQPGHQRTGNTVTTGFPLSWNATVDGEELSGEAPGNITIEVAEAGKESILNITFTANIDAVPERARTMVREIFEEQIRPQIGPALAAALMTLATQGRGGLE